MAFGTLLLKNVGNTPAFQVTFDLHDDSASFIKLAGPITIAAHDSVTKSNWLVEGKHPLQRISSIFNVRGKVDYFNAAGKAYEEPLVVPVQFGGNTLLPGLNK